MGKTRVCYARGKWEECETCLLKTRLSSMAHETSVPSASLRGGGGRLGGRGERVKGVAGSGVVLFAFENGCVTRDWGGGRG